MRALHEVSPGVGAPASASRVRRGRLIVTTPAPAGSGASVLAAALAVRASTRGLHTILIDLDPSAGGIDLLVGAERISGARWPDLAQVRDPLPADGLRSLLPQVPDASLAHVLSMGRTRDADRRALAYRDAAIVQAVVTSAQRDADLVIIDAPNPMVTTEALPWSMADAILLVTGGTVRSFATARDSIETLDPVRTRVGLIVRAPGPRRDHDALALANALHVPLVGELMDEPRLDRQIDDALLPGAHPRSPVGRTADAVLDHLIASAPASRRVA